MKIKVTPYTDNFMKYVTSGYEFEHGAVIIDDSELFDLIHRFPNDGIRKIEAYEQGIHAKVTEDTYK